MSDYLRRVRKELDVSLGDVRKSLDTDSNTTAIYLEHFRELLTDDEILAAKEFAVANLRPEYVTQMKALTAASQSLTATEKADILQRLHKGRAVGSILLADLPSITALSVMTDEEVAVEINRCEAQILETFRKPSSWIRIAELGSYLPEDLKAELIEVVREAVPELFPDSEKQLTGKQIPFLDLDKSQQIFQAIALLPELLNLEEAESFLRSAERVGVPETGLTSRVKFFRAYVAVYEHHIGPIPKLDSESNKPGFVLDENLKTELNPGTNKGISGSL